MRIWPHPPQPLVVGKERGEGSCFLLSPCCLQHRWLQELGHNKMFRRKKEAEARFANSTEVNMFLKSLGHSWY